MTRRIRYQVACSLDGYIAGPNGEYDWIAVDPEIDFAALYSQFDTFLMGRKTYEASRQFLDGREVVVVSRTLRPADHPQVRIVAGDVRRAVDDLRAGPGKDIWLYGGGELFATLLANGQVLRADVVIAAVGVTGRGASVMQGMMSQNVVAVCDVDFGLLGNLLGSLFVASSNQALNRAQGSSAPCSSANGSCAASSNPARLLRDQAQPIMPRKVKRLTTVTMARRSLMSMCGLLHLSAVPSTSACLPLPE